MSVFTTVRCRISQLLVRLGGKLRRPRQQAAETGAGALFSVGRMLRDRKLKKPMVVAGPGTAKAREGLISALEEADIPYALWDKLSVPPTADDGENIRLSWIGERCDCFVALGDGPVIDITKAAAARCARRGRSIMGMVGRNKVGRRRLPTVIAVPTAAGCGAESLGAAAVSDGRGGCFVLEDVSLVPAAAVLDPELLEDVPREKLAEDGMDGLCRAVEAYIRPGVDEKTRTMAGQAVSLFFADLEPCWNSGGTGEERQGLLEASRLAGLASSSAGYGYARAIAQGVQTVCGVPLGQACAAVLPAVLDSYGAAAQEALAKLGETALMAEGTRAEKAAAVVSHIRGMAFRMGLPDTLEGVTGGNAAEIGDLAAAHANPYCVCPAVWTAKRCGDVLLGVCAGAGMAAEQA